MTGQQGFLTGLDVLLGRHRNWLAGRRLGLVSHPAALDRSGSNAGARLWREPGLKLRALFGPEHGFFGTADAGEPLAHRRHPAWRIPVWSLYGRNRQPTPRMFRALDVVIVDLQDLAARPYTYVSTLRLVMEQAAALGKTVVVADRPVPLPRVVDGPLLEPALESFVGAVRTPMLYGLTPGEMALWLRRDLDLDLDLRVARMRGYHRQPGRDADWPPWIPPSPGIRAWETGRCYLATIFGEALPAIDIGRGTNLAFQVCAAAGAPGAALCDRLRDCRLPGAAFYPHSYRTAAGRLADGLRIVVRDPDVFRPVTTGVAILAALQGLSGRRKLWGHPGTRTEFFDRLYGCRGVRLALLAGETPAAIARHWQPGWRAFQRTRRPVLLY